MFLLPENFENDAMDSPRDVSESIRRGLLQPACQTDAG